jgi:septal ring factor EnvC (AmiA/AmiB activator)
MAEKNQDVLDMIEQIRARLLDLEEDVRACEAELPGMATRLDRIDDRIYLLETEVASRAKAAAEPAVAAESASASESPAGEPAKEAAPSKAAEKDDDDNGMNILTPEAKEKIGAFAGDLREVAKTGASTLADINEAISDITSPFKAFTKRR